MKLDPMNPITDQVSTLLKNDPIAEAEKFTGCRVGDTLRDPTAFLGLVLTQQKGQLMRGLMAMQDDIAFGATSWKDCKRIIASEGFQIVLSETFQGTSDETKNEEFIIAWHPDGILIRAESYGGHSMNSGTMHYNIQGDADALFRVRSSGGFTHYREGEPAIMEGSHDIREAFRHNLAKLRSAGQFMPVWHTCGFLWFLTYMDTKDKGYDHKAITASRIAKLPPHVQDAIKGQTP